MDDPDRADTIEDIADSINNMVIEEWLARQEDESETGDGSDLHQCPYCYNLVKEEHEEFCLLNPQK